MIMLSFAGWQIKFFNHRNLTAKDIYIMEECLQKAETAFAFWGRRKFDIQGPKSIGIKMNEVLSLTFCIFSTSMSSFPAKQTSLAEGRPWVSGQGIGRQTDSREVDCWPGHRGMDYSRTPLLILSPLPHSLPVSPQPSRVAGLTTMLLLFVITA